MGVTINSLFAFLLALGVWSSMAALALSFDVIQAAVRKSATTPDLGLIWFDARSDCCHEFNASLAFCLGLTALSAIPMASIATGLRWRRNLPHSEAMQAMFRAAMIIQGASMVLNLYLAYSFFSDELAPPELKPFGWLRLTGAAVSMVAVPMWHRLSRMVSPAFQITLR